MEIFLGNVTDFKIYHHLISDHSYIDNRRQVGKFSGNFNDLESTMDMNMEKKYKLFEDLETTMDIKEILQQSKELQKKFRALEDDRVQMQKDLERMEEDLPQNIGQMQERLIGTLTGISSQLSAISHKQAELSQLLRTSEARRDALITAYRESCGDIQQGGGGEGEGGAEEAPDSDEEQPGAEDRDSGRKGTERKRTHQDPVQRYRYRRSRI